MSDESTDAATTDVADLDRVDGVDRVDGAPERPTVLRRLPWHPLVLAALAYLPALTSAPGRMPADSKLYLYLDPGRLMSDAAGSFDPRQFAGWVPHQHVSFLWPSGPWFWLFDLFAVPDWIAHRLWIGTIMLAAGLGVRWCSRQLGMTAIPALVAAIAYQVSPYVLPYVSRTSVMLLPWAGLGWIVGLTVRATRDRTWRDPALIALVVLTVGAVNATALAMIIPAPVLWLVHAAWSRLVSWRAAATVAARTALLSVVVSLWWIVMLVIQGRHGTDVLPYSESLADVSHTSTSAEVWRGLGYWLFYIRDPFAPTTTESLRYLSSTPAIVISFAVPVMCLAGLVWVRWAHRRFAILLIAAGVVLAVGVHPIDRRSPLMQILTGGGEGGLALALRSSTRALPMMQLGLALAAGSIAAAAAHLRWREIWFDRAMAAGVCALVVANQPGLVTGAWVDPALDRDEAPPDAWLDAAAHLDEGDGRVLMLPGAEFGAYRWGYTVDQPLPGLTERALVTRDLLPLGSPAAMDLLYALDDRFQNDVAESGSLAVVARLFGVDTVWLTNDHAFDRFRTARPEIVRDIVLRSGAIADVVPFGDPDVNVAEVAMVDARSLADPRVGVAAPTVELAALAVDSSLVRAYERTVAIAGSGDGIVDSAAAGLLPPDVGLRYVADSVDAAPTDIGQVITDSNRSRARHWRSSQDTTGFTESVAGGLLVDVASDTRLPVFGDAPLDAFTTAEQRGPVTARATAYGEPFAYLPEHRPFMAIDGDPDTAWLVGEHGDPIGARIELRFPGGSPTGRLRLLQPARAGRQVTQVEIAEGDSTQLDESTRRTVALDIASTTAPGQDIRLSAGTTRVEIRIVAVAGGVPRTSGAVAGVGFASIDVGSGPSHEVVIPPAGLPRAPTDFPTAWVFSRERSDHTDRWRSDPEPRLVRRLDLAATRRLTIDHTVRVDPRASDAVLAELFDWPVVADSRLTGTIRAAGVAAFDGDPGTAWITPFDGALGATITIDGVTEPVDELRITQPPDGFSVVTSIDVRSGSQHRTATVRPGADGTAVVGLEPPLPPGRISVEITTIDAATTIDRRFGDPTELPAAIAELDFDGAPTVAPLGTTTHEFGCRTVATVDGAPLAAELAVRGDGWLADEAIDARPCREQLVLPEGHHEIIGVRNGFVLDRLVVDAGLTAALQQTSRAERAGSPVVTTVDHDRYGGTFTVNGCSAGCMFVFGEGHNDAWSATLDGVSLGPPRLGDGGFNAWWIPPTEVPVEVEITWSARRPLQIALLASLVGALAAVALALRGGRSSRPEPAPIGLVPWRPTLTGRERTVAATAWIVVGFALIGPSGALWGAIAAAVVWWSGRRDLPALTAVATVLGVACYVVVQERRLAPLPDGGWPAQFEVVHDIGMFAVVALVVAALVSADDQQHRHPHEHEHPSVHPSVHPSGASS